MKCKIVVVFGAGYVYGEYQCNGQWCNECRYRFPCYTEEHFSIDIEDLKKPEFGYDEKVGHDVRQLLHAYMGG